MYVCNICMYVCMYVMYVRLDVTSPTTADPLLERADHQYLNVQRLAFEVWTGIYEVLS